MSNKDHMVRQKPFLKSILREANRKRRNAQVDYANKDQINAVSELVLNKMSSLALRVTAECSRGLQKTITRLSRGYGRLNYDNNAFFHNSIGITFSFHDVKISKCITASISATAQTGRSFRMITILMFGVKNFTDIVLSAIW